MVGFFARGRIAWYLAIALGLILLIWGIVAAITWLWVVGIIFILFGGIFLILSYVTKGQTD